MAFKKIELKITFVIDDTNENIVEYLDELKADILSGELQKEMLETDGITSVKMVVTEIQ